MSNINFLAGARCSRPKTRFSLSQVWLSFLFLLLVTCVTARAEEVEDKYYSIFSTIQQADSLNNGGQKQPALAKYRQADTALRTLQRQNPEWNMKLVAYRLNYLAEKIRGLTGEPAPEETDGSSSPRTGTVAAAASTANKASTAATPAARGVKLLSAGAEPRKALRLQPKAGEKQTVNMGMNMDMEIKMGEMQNPVKLPPMKLTFEVTVNTISPEGDIAYDSVISDAGVGDDASADPQVVEAMKTSMAGMKGLSVSGVTTSRGLSKSAQVKTPADMDAGAKHMVDQMKESMGKMATPLPEEAVGVGAKWEHRLAVKSQGLTIDQVTVYELVSLEDTRGTLKGKIVQSAANQKLETPMVPGGKLDLVKLTGAGDADVTFELAHLVPASANVNLKEDFSLSMIAAGQKQNMSMTTGMKLNFTAK